MASAASAPRRLEAILVANRGEIAVRVLRTARRLGYRTVAVYSEADAGAHWVELADDAALLGPAPAAESYLSIERVLDAARATGADAIHPGYGFLSENAAFARACEEAGLVFVGPPADAIRAMGDKAAAKRLMAEAGVPCVPGFSEEDPSDEALLAAAAEVGFPVMVKAAAGGGGRGMRRVEDPDGLPSALRRARSEAQSAFGDGRLLLEKAVLEPRHVEIQVFADAHGTVLHLGERDCSVQRRHQKVLEEAPSPVVTQALRERMGAAAVAAARAVDYRGAGTVEFLLEAPRTAGEEPSEFWFLEMNTRLQVEHPVTEEVTGLDLVELQLRVAEGRPLGLGQEDVTLRGHAIEARLYAEDPVQDFLPASGPVDLWRPTSRTPVRLDTGLAATGGSTVEISPFYDPLVAKVIARGETREEARRRLVEGLGDTALFGPPNNRDFLIRCLEHEVFIAGHATTAFLTEHPELATESPAITPEQLAVAALLQTLAARDAAHAAAWRVSSSLLDWSSSAPLGVSHRYVLPSDDGGLERVVDVTVLPALPPRAERYLARVRGASTGEKNEVELEVLERRAPEATLRIDGRKRVALFQVTAGGRIHLSMGGRAISLEDRLAAPAAARLEGGGGSVRAPMHGSVVEVLATAGDTVKAGDRLLILEAMKMQHDLLAAVDGTVSVVHVEAGAQVAAEDLLMEIVEDDGGAS